MSDFCWLWEPSCRFVIDSGWVQAIGTFVALWIAIEVPRRQEMQRQAERAEDRQRSRQTQLIEIIALTDTLSDVADIYAGQPVFDAAAARERVANAVVRMRSIPTDQLTPLEYKKFRHLMLEASDYLTKANLGSASVDATYYREAFTDYRDDFSDILRHMNPAL